MTDYKKISRNIRLRSAVVMGVIMAFVVVCELDVVSVEGAMVSLSDGGLLYYIQVFMFFYTGACVLAALKGFDWMLRNRVHTMEKGQRASLYQTFYSVRFGLLAGPMLLGALFYYSTLENWGLYYALIAFVASFFCLPSPEGVEIELRMED